VLNTGKRYARASRAEDLQRPPRYHETLADPFRDHLRRRYSPLCLTLFDSAELRLSDIRRRSVHTDAARASSSAVAPRHTVSQSSSPALNFR
jgi:hypothetical protein